MSREQPTTDAPEILLKDVHKRFGRKKVLRGINLEVKRGESLVVIGGSGSGKSVLIKNIIGLMEPTKGEIFLKGTKVSNVSARERHKAMAMFGMLFQGGALFDSLRVWENIAFAVVEGGKIDKKDARDFSISKLAAVGLNPDVADLYPAELSGGMQKRVSLARAIADDPEIIFFDEPTTGLDPIMADVINDLIIKCSEELGATTLTITHDMHSAKKIADNIAMIYEGKIIWHGHTDDMYKSDNEYVDQFIHGRAEGPIKMQIQDH
jgi:phospholipid/cholesterol/gamma-HCH transport system ATP-binding protein